MDTAQPLEPIDIRMVFRAYAAVAGLGGFVLAAWGPMWLGVHMAGQPFGRAALIRVFGAVVIAAACCAAGFASANEIAVLRRSLLWFAGGHAVVAVMVLLQKVAIWGDGPASWAGQFLLALGFILWSFWVEGVARISQVTGLFSRAHPVPAEGLRSTYEQQIREAARQEERNRLARDLHDSIKQQIFVIQTSAATVEARFDEDKAGAREALGLVRGAAREAMTEMEAMLDQLRAVPLENAGLIEALEKQCEALGFRTGAEVEFQHGKLPPNTTLAPGTQDAVFRVAQEALSNIGRHARATKVAVFLTAGGGRLDLMIRDNGAGFELTRQRRGMGIGNMFARAAEAGGTLDLNSGPGAGTKVVLSIPYRATTAKDYRRAAWANGVLLVLALVTLFWRRDPNMLIVAVLCLAASAGCLAAYRKMRKEETK